MFLLSSLIPFGKGDFEKKIKGRNIEKRKLECHKRKNLHQIEMEKFSLMHADSYVTNYTDERMLVNLKK